MKRQLNIVLIALAALLSNGLFLSCQKEELTIISDQKVATNAQRSARKAATLDNDKVFNLAANFFEELPADQLETFSKDFNNLSVAELNG